MRRREEGGERGMDTYPWTFFDLRIRGLLNNEGYVIGYLNALLLLCCPSIFNLLHSWIPSHENQIKDNQIL